MEREYTLKICGNHCNIISEQSEEFVKLLACEVEEKINFIYKDNERVSLSLAATLTAMEFCEELSILKESSENLRSQLRTYLDDAAKAADERDEAFREIERLRREIDALRATISRNK